MEGKIVKIGEIKKAIKQNKFFVENPDAKEEEGGYGTKENNWRTYNSTIESLGRTFSIVLPENYEPYDPQENEFRKYIETILFSVERKNLTAVELGGPGSNLFDGFTNNFFKKTAGVCLKDIRGKWQKAHDKKKNHFVVPGDVMDVRSDETLREVKKALGVEKTDLVISRMRGPLIFINKNLSIYDRIIRNLYKMLNENGLMFIQFEPHPYDEPESEKFTKNDEMVGKWAEIINKKFPEVDIQVADGLLRLHKRAGSPEELPPATQLF